jgi:hypothetical protein
MTKSAFCSHRPCTLVCADLPTVEALPDDLDEADGTGYPGNEAASSCCGASLFIEGWFWGRAVGGPTKR